MFGELGDTMVFEGFKDGKIVIWETIEKPEYIITEGLFVTIESLFYCSTQVNVESQDEMQDSQNRLKQHFTYSLIYYILPSF